MMKKRAIIGGLLVLMFFTTSFIPPYDKLREYLIGEWVYQYSLIDEQKKLIDIKETFPVYKMVFSQCNDSVDILKIWGKNGDKVIVSTVMNMREENVLKNLKYQTFSNRATISL